MQKIKFILIPAFLAAIFVMSCQKEVFDEAEVTNQTIAKQNNNSFLNIPYSDSITLSKFNTDAEIVNYNLARKIALLELDASGFRQELEWEGYTLSKMPVTIYGFDSKPKYYEFIVKDAEGYEVGTVNIEARRKSGAIVNKLSKDIRDYNSLFSKSGDGMQLMADWSGNIYMGIVGKSGEEPSTVVNTETGEQVEGMRELTDEEILDEVCDLFTTQALENNFALDSISNDSVRIDLENEIKADIEAQKDSLELEMEFEHLQRDAYWEAIDEYADSLMLISDEEIVEKSSKFLGRLWRRITGKNSNGKYAIPEYAGNLNYNRGGWCGPWAMNWIYNTKKGGNKYSHFESWASTMGPVGWVCRTAGAKPMFPKEMNVSMGIATKYSIWVNPWYSSGRYNAFDHIKHKKNPIVILTTSGNQMHWKVGYGTYRSGNWWWYNYYFACQDNGSLNISSSNTYMKASWFMLFLKVYD